MKAFIENLSRPAALMTTLFVVLAAVGLSVTAAAAAGWGGATVAMALVALAAMYGRGLPSELLLRWLSARPLRMHHRPDLHTAVAALAADAELRRQPTLYYIPSDVPNALTIGDHKKAIILLTRGLLETLDGRQLYGILAHEIGHIRHGDALWSGFTAGCQLFVVAVATAWTFAATADISVALVVFAIGLIGAAGVQAAMSRSREYRADRAGVALTGDTEGLVSALTALALRPGSTTAGTLGIRAALPGTALLHSHPSVAARIQRLRGSPVVGLREGPGSSQQPPSPRKAVDETQETTDENDDALRCALCEREITRKRERIIMHGAHEHGCMNPHGLTFHIGCFATAPGCRATGPAVSDHSWFPPYRWRVAVCGACSEHLGWRFENRDSGFYGLITGRLRSAG